MDATLARIGRQALVPVVVINEPEDAQPLRVALATGGLLIAEIDYRTDAAVAAIAAAVRAYPDMPIGAGSVLRPSHVEVAVEAGARFVVSPGLAPAVVERTRQRGAGPLLTAAHPAT